ncbi:DNA-binding response regulator [Salipiger sp. CCB-MM3]|uniref:response regulator transcription factor n=1 Tax=Roseobacteraceae TaxID=2854170 RepID=UPI00080A9A7F|nr:MULTISPECIES: response regulator transcription factor [Roseobacteraceae]ANT62389.1 DNA-binding response regulator [Salipiger sp. CCB-MM3]MCA0996945.1 response regulator transcription factor [Alloyangia pacifica]
MRILIADDHDLLRDTLVMFFETASDITVVTAASFGEAEQMINRKGPFDLVLLDFNMPQMGGLMGLETLLKRPDAPRVALISGEARRDVAEKALALGASGFIPKTLTARSLVNAVRFMAMGEVYAPIDFLNGTEDQDLHPLAEKLSKRERQVAKGLTEGKSNKEIARDLDLQEPTIKLHVKTLYRKIGAANRTQAALIARDAGLA